MPAAYAPRRAARSRPSRAEQPVGDLEQDAGTVAGVGLGAGRAAVLEVGERQQAGLDQLVRAMALHVRDERHTTGVVFETRVVQARGPRGRQHVHFHESRGLACGSRDDAGPKEALS